MEKTEQLFPSPEPLLRNYMKLHGVIFSVFFLKNPKKSNNRKNHAKI